jgi:hypothetical protein
VLTVLALLAAIPSPAPAPPARCAGDGAVFVSRGAPGDWDGFIDRYDRAWREDLRCYGAPLGERAVNYYDYGAGGIIRWDSTKGRPAIGVLTLDIHSRRGGGATANLTWMRTRDRPDFCHFWLADPTDAALDAAVARCWRLMRPKPAPAG